MKRRIEPIKPIQIKNNETKEEFEVGIDYLIYFFEEQATKEEYSDIDIELYMNENVEVEEGGVFLTANVKKPRAFTRIKRFFISRFNTYKVIDDTIITPLNKKIEDFKKVFLKSKTLVDEYFSAADVDRDNKITSTDYLQIKKYFLGGKDEF